MMNRNKVFSREMQPITILQGCLEEKLLRISNFTQELYSLHLQYDWKLYQISLRLQITNHLPFSPDIGVLMGHMLVEGVECSDSCWQEHN